MDAIDTKVNLESPPASDEEVLGIITLEDVMEELLQVLAFPLSLCDSFCINVETFYFLLVQYSDFVLQEEIWDETDEYVDIHNR